jgi:hypothetical protein
MVRHGPSSHAFATRRLTAREFRTWIDAYNRAPVRAAPTPPPPELIRHAAEIQCVVCSDLPRALTSSCLLCGPRCRPRASPLFREAGQPVGGDWFVRMPLGTWDRISVLLWRAGFICGDESHAVARDRVRLAAAELSRLAAEFGRVMCVGHGTFNAMVAEALRRDGWTGPARPDSTHWGSSTYRRASLTQPRQASLA